MCPDCRNPVAHCVCSKKTSTSAVKDGVVRVSRETGGRGGKIVTTIKGLALDSDALTRLAKRLKAICGTGGTIKDGIIELQGDQRDAVIKLLAGEGWNVKRAGG